MVTPIQKVALGGALVAFTLLAGYWALLYFAQRSMLFPMPPAANAPAPPAFAEQVWLTASFGRLEAWYLPPAATHQGPAALLLFAHGNGELIDYWPDEFDEPRAWGMGVLLIEYPGYGRSEGSPSQPSITEGMLAAYDWAMHDARVDRSRIIPYGRSLGGGAATVLSLERSVPALILESTFSSVAAFASGFGAPSFLIRDKFDSESMVKKFKGPILIVHGERDDLVPPSHARVLAAAAGNATLKIVSCGHNDCPRPWTEVRAFLVRNGLLIPEP